MGHWIARQVKIDVVAATLALVAVGCADGAQEPHRTRGSSAFRSGARGAVCSHYKRYARADRWGSSPEVNYKEECAPFGSDLRALYEHARAQWTSIARESRTNVFYVPGLSFDVRTEPWLPFEDEASIDEFVAEQDRVLAFLAAEAAIGPPDPEADVVNRAGDIGLAAQQEALLTAITRIDDQTRAAEHLARGLDTRDEDAFASLRARILAPNADAALRDAVASRGAAEALRRRFELLDERVSPLPATVRGLTESFLALRDRASGANAHLEQLAERGSHAELTGIASVEQDIVAWADRELAATETFAMRARAVEAHVRQVSSDLEGASARSATLLRAQGIEPPALPADVARAVGSTAAWAQLRREDIATSVAKVMSSLDARREALFYVATDAVTRDTLEKTRFLRAAQDFTEEQTRRSEELLRLPPRTKRLRAPLLAGKLADANAFAQMSALCTPDAADTAAWRYAGCQIVARNTSRADVFRSNTVPVLLRVNAMTLRRAGVEEARVQFIEQRVLAGAVAEAADANDALLLSIDEREVSAEAPRVAPAGAATPRFISGARTREATGTRGARIDPSLGLHLQTTRRTDLAQHVARLTQERKVALVRLRAAVGTYGARAQATRALHELSVDMDRVLANTSLSLGRADLDALAARHPGLGPSVRPRLVALFDELARSLDAVRAEAVSEMNAARARVASVHTAAHATHDAVASIQSSGAIAYARLVTPRVAIPSLSEARSPSDPNAYLAHFGGRVVADLQSTVRDGVVSDRARFLSIIAGFAENMRALGESIDSRSSTAPREFAELASVERKVGEYAAKYLLESGWFRDTLVPSPLRAALDGGLFGLASAETAVLKRGLNTWSAKPWTADQSRVIGVLDALRAATQDAAADMRSVANTAGLRALLAAAATSVVTEGKLAGGPFEDFCAALAGAPKCTGAATSLTPGERVGLALGGELQSAAFWRAIAGGGADVGSRTANILAANPGASAGELRSLVQRFGGAALAGLAGATRGEISEVASRIGDGSVRDLGAVLSLDDLRALEGLAFLRPLDPRRREAASSRGAVAKALPPLAGIRGDELRSLLAQRGFGLRTGGSTELWLHADGSAVRMAASGAPELPGIAHVTRFVLGSGAAPEEANALAALSDATSQITPAWSAEARESFALWFRSTRAGRPPDAGEAGALEAIWLARTRVPFTP